VTTAELTKASPPVKTAGLYGYVDRATVSEVSGWIWNRLDPLSRRKVDLRVDGELIDSVVACAFREDLKHAKVGDGFYAFRVALPSGRFKHGALLHLADAVSGEALNNSPIPLSPDEGDGKPAVGQERSMAPIVRPEISHPRSESAAAQPSADAGTIMGEIFWADCFGVAGWVADRNDPTRRLQVRASVDGRECGFAIADCPLDRGGPAASDEPRGFRIEFGRDKLIAEGMRVEVRVADTGVILRPRAGVIRTEIQGGLDRCDGMLVRGWALNCNDVSRKVAVEIYVNGELIGEALADRPRDDVKQLGIDDGRCGFIFEFPQPIAMELSRDVAVRALAAGTEVELCHSPWWIGRAARLVPKPLPAKP
jgi:hypothetical protein